MEGLVGRFGLQSRQAGEITFKDLLKPVCDKVRTDLIKRRIKMERKKQDTYTLKRLGSLCEKFVEERVLAAFTSRFGVQQIDTSARSFMIWLKVEERRPILLEKMRKELEKQKKQDETEKKKKEKEDKADYDLDLTTDKK